MKQLNLKDDERVWLGDWFYRDNWWMRWYLHSDPNNWKPQVRDVGYTVDEHGNPREYDTHEEARAFEEARARG